PYADAVDFADGSWPCESSSALRARRRNSETLRIMKLSHPAKSRLYTVLENCIFYISPMYEFSHSQGHSRRFGGLCHTSALPPKLRILICSRSLQGNRTANSDARIVGLRGMAWFSRVATQVRKNRRPEMTGPAKKNPIDWQKKF